MTPTNDSEYKQKQRDDWAYRFTNHTPDPSAIPIIEGLRSAAKAMSDAYISMVPAGREQALALTKLEESLMHAVSGVARTMTADNPDFTPPEKPAEDKTPS